MLSQASAWKTRAPEGSHRLDWDLSFDEFPINLVSLLDGVYRHTGVCVSKDDLRREDVFLSVGSTILWAGAWTG